MAGWSAAGRAEGGRGGVGFSRFRLESIFAKFRRIGTVRPSAMGTGRSLPPRTPRKDSTVSTTTTSTRIVSALCPLLILLLGGCHQSANPAIPLSPVGPLGGSTRVPPPATGSYAVPDGYYQGQASLTPSTTSTLAAGAMEASTLTPIDPH